MKTINIEIENAYMGDACQFKFNTSEEYSSNISLKEVITDYINRIHILCNSEVKSFEYSEDLGALYFDDEIEINFVNNIDILLDDCQKLFDKGRNIFCFKACYENVICWFSFIIKEET